MKLKFLSLFLALGIFTLGTSVQAAEPKAPAANEEMEGKNPEACPTVPWTKLITGGICKIPGLSNLNADCGTWCGNLSSGKPTQKGQVENCMAFIKSGSYGSVVTNLITAGCTVGCSGNAFCNSCKDDSNRAGCGLICCAIDPSVVKNCMLKNNDSCTSYIGTGSKELVHF